MFRMDHLISNPTTLGREISSRIDKARRSKAGFESEMGCIWVDGARQALYVLRNIAVPVSNEKKNKRKKGSMQASSASKEIGVANIQ